MEIYNEVIQDLLNPEAKNLKIHEDPEVCISSSPALLFPSSSISHVFFRKGFMLEE